MDDEAVDVDPWEIRLASDPLAGREVRPHWVDRGELPQGPEAIGVQNWDFFDGAIVGVGVADPKRFVIYGSGVMVVPTSDSSGLSMRRDWWATKSDAA